MTIAIVGATGAVGQEMISCVQRLMPKATLRLFASSRSAGTVLFGITVEPFSVEEVASCTVALLAVSGDFAKEYALPLSKKGVRVIDNSSAFRYDDAVPLVCPLINPEAISDAPIIANPNCTTLIAACALWPLHNVFGLESVIMSTYQAASGAGAAAMDELKQHCQEVLNEKTPTAKAFTHSLAFNLIPHIDSFQENGYTREEMKVVWEMQKIFSQPHLPISVTAVRVPTLRAHSEAITITTAKAISPKEAKEVLSSAPGVQLLDDPKKNIYPMPLSSSGKDAVEVGRIRQNLVHGSHGLDLFVCGDQLLRGAALNAVEIAKHVSL